MASFRRGADDLGDTELDDRSDSDCCRRDCEVTGAAAFAQLAVKSRCFVSSKLPLTSGSTGSKIDCGVLSDGWRLIGEMCVYNKRSKKWAHGA